MQWTYKRRFVGLVVGLILVVGCQRSMAATPDEIMLQCDNLASDPLDPDRYGAPVPDDRFAPGLAIKACKTAVDSNPESGRAWFQLGRAYWLGQHDTEALTAFAQAAKRGYAPAMKYIGDAYKEGRGLPAGQMASPENALAWYKTARDAGLRAADADISNTETAIASLTFRPQLFQNPDYMARLYSGDFNLIDNPIMFFTYTKSFVDNLGGTNVYFMDPKCTTMITELGSTINGFGQLLSYIQTLGGKDAFANMIISMIGSHFTEDQGNRDAVALMHNYKCDNPVTRRIVDNVSGTYQRLPAIINAFVNSRQQVEARRSELMAGVATSCQREFDRAGFCQCAMNVIAHSDIDEEGLSSLRSNFHNLAVVDNKHAIYPSVRGCFRTPT